MLRPTRICPRNLGITSLAIIGCFTTSSFAEEAKQLPEITVEGESVENVSIFSVDLEQAPLTTPDTAELLRRAPGANVNRNGPLTGIAQYRGMYGDRINVQTNGMRINTGGPNGMDPALSYIPRSLLGSLEVIRGIAPVSSGVETVGGTIIANNKTSEFASSDGATPGLDLSGGGATVNTSYFTSGLGSVANRNHRLHSYGSWEDGNNTDISDGNIKPTEFERKNYGAGYGFQKWGHEISLNARRNETEDTGTPSLPMDIDFVDTDAYESEYNGNLGKYDLHGQFYYTDVNHEMSNYNLRNPPMPMMTRRNETNANGYGYRADVSIPLLSGNLMIGSDGNFDDHDATVTDPINNRAFRVDVYNNVDRDAFGFFSEWNGNVTENTNLQLGARFNRVESNADNVYHSMAMMNPAINALQTRFNSANKDNNESNFDLVSKLSHTLTSAVTLRAEAGMKSRAPSYQELYLWVPLQSTNGLADGHNYVGDINLDAETSYEGGLGVDWQTGRFYATPRVFYRYVDDYIQGTPSTDPLVIMISTANGDPKPLQWSNVDAEFYGIDMDWGASILGNWRVDGIVSYVRGKRDDIDDELYRIAPLNGSAMISYRESRWWAGVEGVGYAKQHKVSDTNDERKSNSYGLVNVLGGIDLLRNLSLSMGVENLLDKHYRPHLSGINRVADSDVPVGEHIPGPERNYFATLEYKYD